MSEIVRAAGKPLLSPFGVLFVSVLAMSCAAPLVRFSDANPLAISFWRLAISLPLIAAMLTLLGQWGELRRLRGTEWAVAGVAGVLLAGHFATWIASVQYTSVAASVALVSTQPVWVALFAMVTLGEKPHPRQWAGIALAVAGAAVIGWGDLDGGSRPLLGDLLALIGAVLVAGYYVIGRKLRQRVETWAYVGVVYGFAALALLISLLVTRVPLAAGYSSTDWLVFLALALGPMMIGHTGQNYALGFLPAYAVNLTLLGEPVGATVLAWLLPGIAEVPTLEALAGGVLILSGILLGLRRR